MKKTLMKLLLLIGVFALSGSISYAQPKIGQKVSDIVLKDSAGNALGLYEQKAKIVLIDFWASLCGPCRKSNRELYSLYQKYQSKGFEIYGISLDKSDTDWKKAIVADKIKWLQVIDTGGWDATVATEWKIEYLPTSFLIDENKKVIAINPRPGQLERYLKKLKK